MALSWIRPLYSEVLISPLERRVRNYVETRGGISESAQSLATKLGVPRNQCRQALERLVDEGIVCRREFSDIEPIYSRFPTY